MTEKLDDKHTAAFGVSKASPKSLERYFPNGEYEKAKKLVLAGGDSDNLAVIDQFEPP
jgi:hypothetical protein